MESIQFAVRCEREISTGSTNHQMIRYANLRHCIQERKCLIFFLLSAFFDEIWRHDASRDRDYQANARLSWTTVFTTLYSHLHEKYIVESDSMSSKSRFIGSKGYFLLRQIWAVSLCARDKVPRDEVALNVTVCLPSAKVQLAKVLKHFQCSLIRGSECGSAASTLMNALVSNAAQMANLL